MFAATGAGLEFDRSGSGAMSDARRGRVPASTESPTPVSKPDGGSGSGERRPASANDPASDEPPARRPRSRAGGKRHQILAASAQPGQGRLPKLSTERSGRPSRASATRMRAFVLHNDDGGGADERGAEARAEVVAVAAEMADALEGHGWCVERVPVNRDLGSLDRALGRERPDCVINLCESLAADARGEMLVPLLLDVHGLAYTGSSALSLGLALHKDKCKQILSARGVPTPAFRVVTRPSEIAQVDLPFPLIVKPVREDASLGIDFDSVVHDRASLRCAVNRVLTTFEQPALVEAYVDGREIYVPLLGNQPRRHLPLSEIQFGAAFACLPNVLSYSAKWDDDSPEYGDSQSSMVDLPRELELRCVKVALAAFAALDCRDYGRVDLRVDAEGNCFVIDVNPNCDLHPTAGFAKAAALAGIPYHELGLRLVETALSRHHGNTSDRAGRPRAPRASTRENRELHAGRGAVRARADRREPGARPA